MKKLSKKVINLSQKYRKRGFSHRDIAKKLKIGLGSAFEYTKNITINKKQHLALKRRNLPKITPEQRKIAGSLNPHKFKPQYTKEDLIGFIRKFVEQKKRIPFKKEVSSHKPYVRLFGSWNNAIKAAGFSPNPTKFAKKHRAFDGHKCDSFAEFVIDNWFSQNKILHQIHIPYPGSNMSCDFMMDDTRIEFIGLKGEAKKYDQLLKKKRNLAKKLGLTVIEIYPEDPFPKNKLDKILHFLVK